MTAPTPDRPTPTYKTRPPVANANPGRPAGSSAVPVEQPQPNSTPAVYAAAPAPESRGGVQLMVLFILGGLMTLTGLLILLDTAGISPWHGIGTAFFAAGGAFLAGGLVVSALRR